MRIWPLVLAATLLGLELASAAVPEAVRQLPWRREVRLPATPPVDSWYVVEMDSLLAAATGGDLGALRLVDDAGEPVAAVVLEPSWPQWFAEPLDLTGLVWTPTGDDPVRLTAELDLPPGDYLRTTWSAASVHDVIVEDAERLADWNLPPDNLPDAGENRARAIWRPAASRVRLTVQAARAVTTPDLNLARLTLRADRVRPVPFVARPGTFRGTTYEQVLDLPAGPHAVLSARVQRRDDARQYPVLVDLQRPAGGWERAVAPARETGQNLVELGFETRPILARTLRLVYDAADPPNAPFTVEAVEAVPAALAIPTTVRPPLWLVYGEFAVPSPPGLAQDDLRAVRHLVPLALGEPQASPWFSENVLGTTWLRRRPLVLTAAMVVVLAIVAALVLTERRRPIT